MIFTKNKEGVRAIRAMKYKKYVAGKYTRARAPLARKNTNRVFESKDGTTSTKIVNYIERHTFCFNDLLNKSNRTEIRTYKVEERTFGSPCLSDNLAEGGLISIGSTRGIQKKVAKRFALNPRLLSATVSSKLYFQERVS